MRQTHCHVGVSSDQNPTVQVIWDECSPSDAAEHHGIALGINCLTMGVEFMVLNLANVKENLQHAFGCAPDLTQPLWSWSFCVCVCVCVIIFAVALHSEP